MLNSGWACFWGLGIGSDELHIGPRADGGSGVEGVEGLRATDVDGLEVHVGSHGTSGSNRSSSHEGRILGIYRKALCWLVGPGMSA